MDTEGVLGATFRVTEPAGSADIQEPAVVRLINGTYVFAWMGHAIDGSSYGVAARLFSSDGIPLGDSFRVNSVGGHFQGYPRLVALPNGGFAVTWRGENDWDGNIPNDPAYNGSFVRFFSATGEAQTSDLRVTSGFSVPSLHTAPDGRVDVIWSERNPNDQTLDVYRASTNIVVPTSENVVLEGTSASDVLLGSSNNTNLFGFGGDDYLAGAAGADILDGGTGADSMNGGGGSDIYFVDTAADQVFDSGGAFDALYTTVTYALRPDVAIELIAARTPEAVAGFALYGNDFIQSVIGNNGHNALYGLGGDDGLYGYDGDDIMDGGTGADVMDGGTGGDIYFVDNAGDVIIENDGGGNDWLYSSVSYGLGTGSYVENIGTRSAEGTEAINLYGSNRDNTIIGNNGANILAGGGGSDNLRGLDGNDLLDGGRGQDFLEGGAGADTFRFEFETDSALGAADAIFDFVSGTDKIDLALIDADSGAVGDQAFTFLGSAAFSGRAGELRAESIGNTTHIIGDVNGDGVADLHIILYNTAGVTAGDFIL